jgi:hypothetical protein
MAGMAMNLWDFFVDWPTEVVTEASQTCELAFQSLFA